MRASGSRRHVLGPFARQTMSSDWQGGAARLREMALSSLQRGDAMQAQQSFAQLLALLPRDADALQIPASRHLVRGEAIRAVSSLLAAVQSVPRNANILHDLGTAQMAAGNLPGAVRILRDAVKTPP